MQLQELVRKLRTQNAKRHLHPDLKKKKVPSHFRCDLKKSALELIFAKAIDCLGTLVHCGSRVWTLNTACQNTFLFSLYEGNMTLAEVFENEKCPFDCCILILFFHSSISYLHVQSPSYILIIL